MSRYRTIVRQAFGEPTLVQELDEGEERWLCRYLDSPDFMQVDVTQPAKLSLGRGVVQTADGTAVQLSLPALFAWASAIGLNVEGEGALFSVTRVSSDQGQPR